MMKLNLVVWVGGLALQCTLLWLLFRRRIVGVTPIFATLIAFYIVRSVALYSVSLGAPRPAYELFFGGLAVVDLLLQTAVAWELFSALLRSTRAPHPLGTLSLFRRVALFSGFALAAAGIAVLLAARVHASPRAPLDRGVLFTSALFLFVFFASLLRKSPLLTRRMAQGFAIYAAAGIPCQIGRTLAVVNRNAAGFSAWSYAESASYLAAVLFWICLLPRGVQPDTPAAESAQPQHS